MKAPLQYIEDWLSSTSLLLVQLQLLSVDSSCSVAISYLAEGECNAGGSGESSSAVTGIVAGILSAVVVLVIMVALIVILALVYRHRYSTINIKRERIISHSHYPPPQALLNIKSHKDGDIHLSGVHDLMSTQMEEDNHVDHEYESIEMSTVNTLSPPLPSFPSPLPADTGNYIIDSCPAYGITTQGQSTSDENPETHYFVMDDVQ